MIDISYASLLLTLRHRNFELDIVDDFYTNIEKILNWINKNPEKAMRELRGKNLKTRQQKYYYKGV
jgi:hypothetical protein